MTASELAAAQDLYQALANEADAVIADLLSIAE